MEKNKIGIITLNGYVNYGNRLQNYALQEVLKSLDLNVSIDETGVVYSNGNIVLKELSAQKLNSDSNITGRC